MRHDLSLDRVNRDQLRVVQLIQRRLVLLRIARRQKHVRRIEQVRLDRHQVRLIHAGPRVQRLALVAARVIAAGPAKRLPRRLLHAVERHPGVAQRLQQLEVEVVPNHRHRRRLSRELSPQRRMHRRTPQQLVDIPRRTVNLVVCHGPHDHDLGAHARYSPTSSA